MPVRGVHHCLRDFNASVLAAVDFQKRASQLRLEVLGGVYRRLGVRDFETLSCLTLLKVHLAWEDFIESVFLRYMCGAQAPGGNDPVLIGPAQPNVVAAMNQLLRPNWAYLQWGAQNTLDWANKWFQDGEPFSTAIGAIRQTVDDVAAVRNRFAHRSHAAEQRFRNVVRGRLGFVPRGMTAGRFLLTPNPNAAQPQNFLELYANTLIAAGAAVVQ